MSPSYRSPAHFSLISHASQLLKTSVLDAVSKDRETLGSRGTIDPDDLLPTISHTGLNPSDSVDTKDFEETDTDDSESDEDSDKA